MPCWDKECETLYRSFTRAPVGSDQGRRQRGSQWCPAPPFHVWPTGCCIHPILYFKNVPPSGFGPPCCYILATGLGLTLTEPPRLYYLGSGRSRSDGRKLSTPSTSRTRRKTWSTINKLTGKSRRSSRLCPVSANSIASQLVENGAHKTGGRESTRLINKQLSDLRKNQTPEGHSISEPFRPEEFAAALRRLKPGTSRGLDFIFREFILHTLSALKFWFCDFLNSCMRQLKIPKIWRRALVVAIPKPEKSLGDPKSYRPISLLCVPFKFLERLIYLVSKQSPTHCSHMSRLVPTLEVGRRPGQSVDTGHRG